MLLPAGDGLWSSVTSRISRSLRGARSFPSSLLRYLGSAATFARLAILDAAVEPALGVRLGPSIASLRGGLEAKASCVPPFPYGRETPLAVVLGRAPLVARLLLKPVEVFWCDAFVAVEVELPWMASCRGRD